MKHSPLLAAFIADHDSDDYDLSDASDMSSTTGYDNDGSTGPEMIDNGIALGRDAQAYSPTAEIFWADEEGEEDDTRHYVFGHDEADALRRLTEAGQELASE